MAESKALKKLESEVTCPLCLEILTEPKRLPCDHVYCAQCLRGLALRSITGSISCPECRQDTPVPPNFDVTQFATPHQVNRLIEMYQQNLKLEETDRPAPQPATCTAHKSQPLALYCETCESLVCRDCALLSCAKKIHNYGFIEEFVKKYQSGLQQQLKPIKALCQQMLSALERISMSEKELENKKAVKVQQIQSTFDALAEVLAEERKYFLQFMEKSVDEQKKLNKSKTEEISKVVTELESTILSLEKNEEGSKFLAKVANQKREIEDALKLARNVALQPTQLPDVEIELLNPTKFKELCHLSNFTYQTSDPLKSRFPRSVKNQSLHVQTNELATTTLYIDPQDFKETRFKKLPLCAQLQCCYDDSLTTVSVKKIASDQFSLSFVPHKRGRHELHILYNDILICGSPLPVYVTIPPHQLKAISSKKIHTTGGIKCHGGSIYVSDANIALTVLNPVTYSIRQLINIPRINETVVTKNYVYATDHIMTHQVLKMDRNGIVLKTSGRKGSGPGQFDYPNGIRMSKDKEIYVCDTGNHRIQVLDEDLNVIRVIGRKGEMNGCFRMPDDLDFDEEGNIYVAEQCNHRIQVLTKKGQHIRNIGSPGRALGELDNPISPAIFRNMLYVTDCINNRISVFQLTGEFITTFGHDLIKPECIAIDEDGYIHVTCNKEEVVKF